MTRERIRDAAIRYLKAELPRLEAAGLIPAPGRDNPWIERRRLWRLRGRGAAEDDLANELNELIPGRWRLGFGRAEEYVEALVRGVVAAATVETLRYGEVVSGPGPQVDELLDHLEHPEQPVRVMRLLLDLDASAVDGQELHDARIRHVHGIRETISPEIPEGASASDDAHVSWGSTEPSAFLVAEGSGRDGWIVAFDVRPHLAHGSTALRLVTAGSIVEPFEVYGQPKMVHTGGPNAVAVDPEQATSWLRVGVVNAEELAGIDAIATRICELDDRSKVKIPPAIIVALSRFNRSHRTAAWADVVIDIAIGLEAALSTGEREEITLRIKTRAAQLLARAGDPPSAIFEDVGELLKIRGKVAHGEVIPPKRWEDLFAARGLDQVMVDDRVAVLFDRWRDLLRRAILARLLLEAGGSGPWRFDRDPDLDVDEAMVDPRRRREWRTLIRRRAIELGIPRALDKPIPLRDFLHEPFREAMNR
ncbi:MAG TPA: hypothetical protein VE011_09715 [Candidatus Dormibacteraeota bacterium]|nr:hypothetical protein [Candidatus Dormibacteraeota bacterium]